MYDQFIEVETMLNNSYFKELIKFSKTQLDFQNNSNKEDWVLKFIEN